MNPFQFKPPGICYFSNHAIDWLAIPAAAAFCLWFFVAIDRNLHSLGRRCRCVAFYGSGNSYTWKPMNFHYRNKADIWRNTTQ